MSTERERALNWLVQAMIGWHQAQIIPDKDAQVAFLLEHYRRAMVQFTEAFGDLRPALDLINDELYKELCSLRLRAQLGNRNMNEDELINLVNSIVERYSPINTNPSSSTDTRQ